MQGAYKGVPGHKAKGGEVGVWGTPPYISCSATSHEGADVGGGRVRTTAGRVRTGVERACTFARGREWGWGGRARLTGKGANASVGGRARLFWGAYACGKGAHGCRDRVRTPARGGSHGRFGARTYVERARMPARGGHARLWGGTHAFGEGAHLGGGGVHGGGGARTGVGRACTLVKLSPLFYNMFLYII
jgi:hypothetical protein